MKKNLGSVFFYALLFVLGSFFIINIVAPDKTIDIFRIKTYMIVSPSMEPTLNINDVIVITKVREENIKVGDIITFKTYISELETDSYVTHYVGDIQEKDGVVIYKTHGEGRNKFDNWTDANLNSKDITYSDIQGKYLFKIPYLGYLLQIIKDPILDLLLVTNGLVIYGIYRYVKYLRTDNSKNASIDESDK